MAYAREMISPLVHQVTSLVKRRKNGLPSLLPEEKTDPLIEALHSIARPVWSGFVDSEIGPQAEMRLTMRISSDQAHQEKLMEMYERSADRFPGWQLSQIIIPEPIPETDGVQTEWIFHAAFPSPGDLIPPNTPKPLPVLGKMPVPPREEWGTSTFFNLAGHDLDEIQRGHRAIGRLLSDLNTWTSIRPLLVMMSKGKVQASDLNDLKAVFPVLLGAVVESIEQLCDSLPLKYRIEVRKALLARYYDYFYTRYENTWKPEVTEKRERLFRCYDRVLEIVSLVPGDIPPHLSEIRDAIIKNAQTLNMLLGVTTIAGLPHLSMAMRRTWVRRGPTSGKAS